jgi:hypothetical protein
MVAAIVLASFAPAARAQQARSAMPGTVNYIEGRVAIDGVPLTAQQNGQTTLRPNQVLSTTTGKAEVLLSPGVLVRVGNQSQLRMVSAELVDPVIEVLHGEAMVEADRQGARTNVLQQGANASILKQGLYRFNADRGNIKVIDGKIEVALNGRSKEVGRGREIDLANPKLKTVSFNRKAEDDLYQWSSIRSGYLAEASGYTAQNINAGYYSPYWGNDWYWDPYFDAWSWMPGYGFFYSPFGYPFYSPGFAMYGRWGWGGYGYGGRFGRGGFGYGSGRFGGRPAGMMARGGFGGGGFHGGGFGGGGFHGGGGGGGGRR